MSLLLTFRRLARIRKHLLLIVVGRRLSVLCLAVFLMTLYVLSANVDKLYFQVSLGKFYVFFRKIFQILEEHFVLFHLDRDAESFALGKIGELCHSDGGGEKRIFFIETSGHRCLRPRQACAVESAALTNPDMTVHVYMSLSSPPGNPEVDYGDGLERHCRTMDLIKSLPNVRVLYEDLLSKYLTGTPLESLYVSGQFNKSRYSYQHVSDAVRVALLYRYGGIYLDLDVVVLRSLKCLRNTAGHVNILGQLSVENDVLVFDRGHKLLNFFMRWMKQTYKADERSVIGPQGLAHAFRLFCSIPPDRKLSEVAEESFVCHGNTPFTLMPPAAFHPIGFFDQNHFFTCDYLPKDLDVLRFNSYTVHVYGAGHGAHVPKSSLYAFLARRFCPVIYSESLKNVYQF